MSDKGDYHNGKRKGFTEERQDSRKLDTKHRCSEDMHKKLKQNDSVGTEKSKEPIKSTKIQLKLGTVTSSPKTNSIPSSFKETVKPSPTAFVNKIPTGNLASSKKDDSVLVKKVSDKVASVFGDESSDEEEEMPFEAKMKMRNLGRKTPTSSGPNSYGKNNLGFCDSKKLFEKQLQEQADELLKQEEIRKNKKFK